MNLKAPTFVPELRARWRDRVGPAAWDAPIARSDATTFIVLGDPGEQDASQFVVAPALERATLDHAPAFMVICSDVIYPSGDVNDYADGFYVPYENLLKRDPLTGRAPLEVFALPGNHDWYDGLTGFMWHFCCQEPLDDSAYGGPERGAIWEWPARLLWRRPSKLRKDLGLEKSRGDRLPDGPLQRGSYFAIEMKHLCVVCIDSGIEGEIDRTQAEWLAGVSCRSPQPKVLLTGKPLLVDNMYKPGRIIDAPVACPNEGCSRSFCTVDDIVRHEHFGYVAAIGGDIHNFQHYESAVDGRPFDYVVSGGGGAYMSATHPIRPEFGHDEHASPDAFDAVERSLQPEPYFVPDPATSFEHFAGQLLPGVWRLFRALLLGALGVFLARVAESQWATSSLRGSILPASAIVLGAWLVVRVLLPAAARKTPTFRFFAAVAVLLGGFVAGLAGWWLAPERFHANLEGWAEMAGVGAYVALLLRFTGWWQSKTGASTTHSRWWSAACVLVVVAAGVAARLLLGPADSDLRTEAVSLLVGVALAGYVLRAAGGWSGEIALAAAATAQLFAGVLFVFAIAPPGADPAVAWALGGIVAGPLAAIAALLLALAAAWVFGCTKRGPARREAWGTAGRVLQPLLPFLIAGVVVAAAWLLRHHDAGRWHAGATAAATVLVPVGTLFAVDWVRRRSTRFVYAVVVALFAIVFAVEREAPVTLWLILASIACLLLAIPVRRAAKGGAYKVDLVFLAAAGVGLLWAGDVVHGWVPEAAVAGAILLALVLGTLALVHLVFLGAGSYLIDWCMWRNRNQFKDGEAEEIVAWRNRNDAEPRPARRLRRRANIVFPGARGPHGPLQQKVAEVFDVDYPPFYKNFLVLKTDDDQLEILPYCVSGDSPGAATIPYEIRIPLPRAGA